MRRLGDPVVGPEPQAADPLGDGRALGADDHARGRAASRRPARGSPSRRGPRTERSTSRALSFIASRSSGGGPRGLNPVLPAGGLEAPRETCRKPLSSSIIARRTRSHCDGSPMRYAAIDGQMAWHAVPFTGLSHAISRLFHVPPGAGGTDSVHEILSRAARGLISCPGPARSSLPPTAPDPR